MYKYADYKKVQMGEFGNEFIYIVYVGNNLEKSLENAF